MCPQSSQSTLQLELVEVKPLLQRTIIFLTAHWETIYATGIKGDSYKISAKNLSSYFNVTDTTGFLRIPQKFALILLINLWVMVDGQ